MFDFMKDLPSWVGTAPQWAMMILLAIAVVRTSPQWLEAMFTAVQNRRSADRKRITELEAAIAECRRLCDEQDARLQQKIEDLQHKLSNEALQRVQSEISLVHTLIQIVDAPALKAVLTALERRQTLLFELAPAKGADDEEAEDEGS